MSLWEIYSFIGFGSAALLVALFGKNFRKTDATTMMRDLGPASTWSGKLLFALVGVTFLSFGFYKLFHP